MLILFQRIYRIVPRIHIKVCCDFDLSLCQLMTNRKHSKREKQIVGNYLQLLYLPSTLFHGQLSKITFQHFMKKQHMKKFLTTVTFP